MVSLATSMTKAKLELTELRPKNLSKLAYTMLRFWTRWNNTSGDLEIASKLCLYQRRNLNEIMNFYSSWNHPKTSGFMVISGGIEVNKFA